MTTTIIDGIYFMDPKVIDEEKDFSQLSITVENNDTLIISIFSEGENKGIIAMEKEDALHVINVLKSYTDSLLPTDKDFDFLNENFDFEDE